jgi:outer membrane receptor protein involved in Fe transport
LAVAVVVLAGGTAQAQQGTGTIQGTVVDNATKKPLPEVIVMVKSPALQEDQITVTDSSGFYRIPSLPVGVYSIHFEGNGYFPNQQDGINVRSDVTYRLNAALAVAQGEAEEVVVRMRPNVDVGSSTTATTLDADLLKRVPVSAPGGKGSGARSFESVAELAPGTSSDDYGTGINGASSPENHYAIDGLSVGNPGKGIVGTQLSTEFVGEVNVVTSGYMPEFGRTSGGVLNVVTKNGSNTLFGSVFMYVSPGALEGKRTLIQQEAQPVSYESKLGYIGDIGFDLGGPIIKDKLWFYVGFDISQTRYDINRAFRRTLMDGSIEGTPLDVQPFVADSRTIQGIAKLTYSLNADNRLSFQVFGTPTSSGGGASFDGTTVTPGKYAINPQTGHPESGGNGTYSSVAHTYVSNPIDAILKWNSQFMQKKLLLDVTLGTHWQVDANRAADGSTALSSNTNQIGSYYNVNYRRGMMTPDGYHDIREFEKFRNSDKCDADGANCKVADYVSGAPRDLNEATYNRHHGHVIVSYLANFLGHHVIKAGFQGEFTSYRNQKSNKVFLESEDGTQFDDEERFGLLTGPDMPLLYTNLTKRTSSTTLGGFLQDSWSVLDKVTLNLGLRYDTQQFYNTQGAVALTLPNQWSPRVGVIYDPTQSGRSKVFVNYARYYENVPLDFGDVALLGEPQLKGGHDCDASVFKNQIDDKTDQGCLTTANLRPNSNENPRLPNRIFRNSGSPGTLDPDLQASSSDEISAGGEYEVIPDARVGINYTKRWINRWIEDMGPVVDQPGYNGNPGFGLGAMFPKVKRNYDAFTLYGVKSFSRGWLAQASYTMAFLRGNYAGLIAPEDGYLGPNATADFDGPNIHINRDGALPGDRRHTFKVMGAKDWQILPKHHLGTGLSLRARSGGATSYLAADPFTYSDETYLVQRGTGPRMPWSYGADLQLAYRVAMVGNIGLAVTMDIFNVLNFQGVVGRSQTYTHDGVVAKDGTKIADLDKLTHHDGDPIAKNPNFGAVTAYQQPRVFRFGVRGTF